MMTSDVTDPDYLIADNATTGSGSGDEKVMEDEDQVTGSGQEATTTEMMEGSGNEMDVNGTTTEGFFIRKPVSSCCICIVLELTFSLFQHVHFLTFPNSSVLHCL